MPSDLRIIDLTTTRRVPTQATTCRIRQLTRADSPSLAAVYCDSYPPDIGAADLAEAEADIAATFAGDYGVLLWNASRVAEVDGQIVGAILVTERSIWEEHLEGPFIIELFVSPASRSAGIGRLLVLAAIEACRASGHNTLSLRVGDGTSAAAFNLYEQLGFVDPN